MSFRNRSIFLCLSVVVVAGLLVTVAFAQSPARQALDRKLAEYRDSTNGGEIIEISSPAFADALPRHSVFVLRFRMYPVARMPQPPLAANNIFIVKPDQTVELVTTAEALQRFFAGALPKVESGAAAESAAKAWLRLNQELRQDGMFRFNEPVVSAPVMTRDFPPSNIRISGSVSVVPNNGDMGQISATLVFERGKLTSATSESNLKGGMRPIG
jgi:hypothetical protein